MFVDGTPVEQPTFVVKCKRLIARPQCSLAVVLLKHSSLVELESFSIWLARPR